MGKVNGKANGKSTIRKAREISAEQWERILEAYRATPPPVPGAHTSAATAGGVTRKTASKVWNRGVAYLDKPPIKELVQKEQIAARAAQADTEKRHALEEAERAYRDAEKARDQAIKTRRQEADMVGGFRASVIGLVGLTGTALRGAMDQVQEVEKALREGKDPVTGQALTVKDRMDIMWRLSRMIRIAGESSLDVIRAERLLLGEPTEILGFRDMDKLTPEDAIRELREAGAMAERMERRKDLRLKLIPGGAAEVKKTGTD